MTRIANKSTDRILITMISGNRSVRSRPAWTGLPVNNAMSAAKPIKKLMPSRNSPLKANKTAASREGRWVDFGCNLSTGLLR